MNDAMQEASHPTALEERQRSMLEAMGIRLWQPPAASVAEPQAVVQPAVFEEKQPSALIKSALNATNIVAEPVAKSSGSVPSGNPSLPVQTARASGIEQMTWSELQNAVASCGACSLCHSRQKTVFGVGPVAQSAPQSQMQAPQVDWLIVGEAPGEQEDIAGEPFVGPAGKLLDNMLAAMSMSLSGQGRAMHLSRTQGSYIANVLKCRPPANRNPSPEEVAMCEPYLARQIELLRPKIILAMGKFAIASLTGSQEAVGKLRGRVHALRHASYQAPVIVTYHPAYLLRNLPDKAKAWADLLLAMQTYSALPPA
jgi:uracil-DNA glycosylase